MVKRQASTTDLQGCGRSEEDCCRTKQRIVLESSGDVLLSRLCHPGSGEGVGSQRVPTVTLACPRECDAFGNQPFLTIGLSGTEEEEEEPLGF
jgi:hypothetical protein